MNRALTSLIEKILPLLSERGFKIKKGADVAFMKRTRFGFLYLSFPSFPMPDNGVYQVVKCGLDFRHDRIENIVNNLGHIWGDANREKTTTVYRGL